MDAIKLGHLGPLIVPNICYCNHFSWKLLPWSPLSKIWNSWFSLISHRELLSFLSAGPERISSTIFKNYLTRMIQEGYLKSYKCILNDFEKKSEQLLWSLGPVCGEACITVSDSRTVIMTVQQIPLERRRTFQLQGWATRRSSGTSSSAGSTPRQGSS